MAQDKAYDCECISCGHKETYDDHCDKHKCPECGGQMRRAERPGPGQSKQEAKHRDLFRAGVAKGIKDGKSGVDRENGIINRFAVISKGEAIGHGIEIDDETLDGIVELGNKLKLGAKSRFGHPNMSNTALGTFLGRVKNFEKAGDIVRADLYFDETAYKTPDGDLAAYVMDLAESDPDAFGSSIVFDYDMVYRLNEDGTRKKDEKTGEPLLPLVRPKKLWAVDTVDDPAANEGMFNIPFFSDSVLPAAGMTAFLDSFLRKPDAVKGMISFLERYVENRDKGEAGSAASVAVAQKGDEVKTGLKTNKEEGKDMELRDLTLDMLKADRPDLVETLSAKAKEEGKTEGEKLERKRVTDILDKAGEFKSMEDLPLESIKAGDSLETADGKFKAKKIVQLEKGAPASPGGSGDPETPEDESQLSVEEKAEKAWEKDPKLREEFTSKEAYIAFEKYNAKGRVKIVNN